MANYALTKWSTTGSAEECLAAMETKLETVDNTKVIYVASITKEFNDFIGLLLYAAQL